MTLYRVEHVDIRGEDSPDTMLELQGVESRPLRPSQRPQILEFHGLKLPIVVEEDDSVRIDLSKATGELGYGVISLLEDLYPCTMAQAFQRGLRNLTIQPPMHDSALSIRAPSRDRFLSVERHEPGWSVKNEE